MDHTKIHFVVYFDDNSSVVLVVAIRTNVSTISTVNSTELRRSLISRN